MRIAGDSEECGIRRNQYTDVKNAKEVFRLECAIIAVGLFDVAWCVGDFGVDADGVRW
jgi:hypothetical protein